MKWVFYVIVFVYMFYRSVYGLNTNGIGSNQIITLDDNSDYGDGIFVAAGERKIISCKASGKNQEIKWYNPKGLAISRIQSGRVYTSQYFVQSPRAPALVLNITEAEVHDSGVWVCRAGDTVRNVSICVIDPTNFEGTPTEVAADEGRSYTLSCQTKGEPEATISWTRNGRVINEFDYQDMPKYRVMTKYNRQGIEGLLTIMSLSVEDSGVYTCIATQETELADKCGKNQTVDIVLNINHAPTFGERTKENVYGMESESLFLRCEADGYPLPTYKWFVRNGGANAVQIAEKEIGSADNGSASVLPVKVTEDSFDSQYICQASNQLGDVELEFHILESMMPKKPDEVEINEDLTTSKTIVFNVSWNEEIRFDISKIEVQYMPTAQLPRKRATALRERDWKHSRLYSAPTGEVLEDSTMAVLEGLEPSTEYWVRLRIKNDIGDSLWSNSIRAATKEGKDDEEEENEAEDQQIKEDRDVEEATEPEPDTTEDDSLVTTEKQATPPSEDSGRFYGLFFAAGVLIVAVGCTFVVRMV
ncbi:limbic system-associated membrane protein-like [Cydia splendana]|uniref:limbic system-associated membrane protein-like n=1 Tax=Cydia splendana TaxID=1100963 RepID=UPI002137EC19